VVIAETGEMVRIDRSFLSDLSETACVVVGRAGSFLKEEAAAADIELHELLGRDDFALHNAVPTAEGAIWEAMKRSDVTVAGSNTHVVGYGRCGKVLANHLQGLNSTVTVVSQTSEKRAEAAALGFQDQPLEYWDDLVGQADFIFNTVPAQLVDAAMLARTRDSVVIIDIASAPGGVDFQAAHDLGREAVLTPSLPGKQAPRTAGIAMARVIRELLQL
jgi:dipicolinate synthase subunit A